MPKVPTCGGGRLRGDRGVEVLESYCVLPKGAAMETTKVSSKGQVVLPRAVRERKKWQSGTQLLVEETKDGVLLRSGNRFRRRT